MHLFLRYDLSKRYCENFFVTLFYNWKSKLFIPFVSKKDLKKCSIRCVELKCSSLNVSNVTLYQNKIVSKWKYCKIVSVIITFFTHPVCCCYIVNLFRECAVEEYALWKFLALDLLLNVCVFKGLEP